MERSLKSSWVLMGQGIRLLSIRGTQPTHIGCPMCYSFPSSGRAHLGWKCTSAAKHTPKGLVLPGRQKSGTLTHSVWSVKEEGVGRRGWGERGPSICPFHLLGQSRFPCPPSRLYQGYLRPPVYPGLLWDASSAMTVAEGSPGQVEA